MSTDTSIESISVIVPDNPFVEQKGTKVCLCALDVEKLMEWWPGTPHSPHRNASKVRSIQRSLDWKRVAHIAAYLLQKELIDVRESIETYFGDIYEPLKHEPGREWPPRVGEVTTYQRSIFRSFSNVLLHVNGAKVVPDPQEPRAAFLRFRPDDAKLSFSVIDGQHRINGAYLAIKILQETRPNVKWEVPAQVYVDLDHADEPPRHQAQIFIDVNFYQKKVDRSLVADLFPTARGPRRSLDDKERAQDIGRKLMLETGPLVGMIQIPGIKYGVKDVITLSTFVGAIEDVIDVLHKADLTSLDEQVDFIAQTLTAWLEATGRRESLGEKKLESGNVVYQGRILVSVINLIPAVLWALRKSDYPLISARSGEKLTKWFRQVIENAGLISKDKFIDKNEFKKGGYLGAGGIGRFQDRLWAAVDDEGHTISRMQEEKIAELAEKNRKRILPKIARD
jgi:DGQHR domain-containing protein